MEPAQIHHPKVKIILLVLGVIVIAAITYILLKNKAPNTNGGLSDEQKQAILAELASQSANQTPMTEAEKSAVLKELSSQSKETKPLSDEEKQAILNALAQ